MLRKLFARPKPIGAQRAHWARPKIEPGYGSSYQCEISEGTEFNNQLMNTNKCDRSDQLLLWTNGKPKTSAVCMHYYSAPKSAHIHVYPHDKLTLVTLDLGAMNVTVHK